ncbi:MAG: efflux RND transporter periplasmic adaptor subunit [Bryobacterales bacterium]|nr:efflux RND transporter periplasmic adaptor subunit [Bryobacterales bacterium]
MATRDSSSRTVRWIAGGILLFLLLGVARFLLVARAGKEPEVQVLRVAAATTSGGASANVILDATGYIVAHHKIQVASKVVGKVAWIGVEKGDHVKENQVIVRLEDAEYRAQLRQAQGNVAAVEGRVIELRNGSRPEEIEVAKANLESAQADLNNARISLARIQRLVDEKVAPQQQLDDAKGRYDNQAARVASLERTHELVRVGPRKEAVMQAEGQLTQARGQVDFYQTQLNDTVIRAPITGTILERIVEKGEFVTTGFVGDRGAKGYVVSMADLRDLQVELDINQADFARLRRGQKGIIATDAYPDRKYEGVIDEIAPEANRQKATVQVKVKVNNPDDFLRPEMNASVSFVSGERPAAPTDAAPAPAAIYLPATAVRDGSVFVVLNGKVVRHAVKTAGITAAGLRIEDGLIGGEDIIVAPTSEIKEGIRVRTRQ